MNYRLPTCMNVNEHTSRVYGYRGIGHSNSSIFFPIDLTLELMSSSKSNVFV